MSLKDVKKRFVDSFPESKTRNNHFNRYLEYSKYLHNKFEKAEKHVLNGSFITIKIDPNNIDFLVVVNMSKMSDEEFYLVEDEFHKQFCQSEIYCDLINKIEKYDKKLHAIFCCDWYPLYKREKDDPLYYRYLKEKKYWLNCWGHSRKDNKGIKHSKGLITIDISDLN